MKSIVPLKTKSGHVNEVHDGLGKMQTVLECCMPFGCYEEVAIVQAETLEELWQILASRIKPICGVLEIFSRLIKAGRSLKNPLEHVREFVYISI